MSRAKPRTGAKAMALTPATIAAIKSRYKLSDIVGRRVRLRPAGAEMLGLCPFHDEETPSFRVNNSKGLFHCFGCGAGGDLLDYLREIEGMAFREAMTWLTNVKDLHEIDPADREQQIAHEHRARTENVARAREQWHQSRELERTIGERYLRSRGLGAPWPQSFRFGWFPIWYDKRTGKPGRRFPAVICAVTNNANEVTGVQRIFLDRETAGKAAIANPKLSLGQTRGNAIRIGGAAATIILTEGPEDGLTLRLRYPEIPVWIALGTGGLYQVQLPETVRHVILAGDNNGPGHEAVRRAQEAYEAQGRTCEGLFPSERFEDFNDELRNVPIAA